MCAVCMQCLPDNVWMCDVRLHVIESKINKCREPNGWDNVVCWQLLLLLLFFAAITRILPFGRPIFQLRCAFCIEKHSIAISCSHYLSRMHFVGDFPKKLELEELKTMQFCKTPPKSWELAAVNIDFLQKWKVRSEAILWLIRAWTRHP